MTDKTLTPEPTPAIERAAEHLYGLDDRPAAARAALADALDVEEMARPLVAHQRMSIGACMCGWSELGRSHTVHQAEAVRAALLGGDQ